MLCVLCYIMLHYTVLYYVPRPPRPRAGPRRSWSCGFSFRPRITDGIGTPDPNPRHLVNWCIQYMLVNITYICLN